MDEAIPIDEERRPRHWWFIIQGPYLSPYLIGQSIHVDKAESINILQVYNPQGEGLDHGPA